MRECPSQRIEQDLAPFRLRAVIEAHSSGGAPLLQNPLGVRGKTQRAGRGLRLRHQKSIAQKVTENYTPLSLVWREFDR